MYKNGVFIMKAKDKGHSTEGSGDHRLTWKAWYHVLEITDATHDTMEQSNKYAEAAVLKMGCFNILTLTF